MASVPEDAPSASSNVPQIPIIIKKPAAGVATAGPARIPGVLPSVRYGQQVVSTGIPSLDSYLGNGFPVSSVVIIEDSFPGQYSDMLLKCFIAEGATYNHHIFVSSGGTASSSAFASQLPSLVSKEEAERSSNQYSETESMRIAWRYKDASPLPTTLSTRGLGTASANKIQQKLLSKFEFAKKSTVADLGGKHLTVAESDKIDFHKSPMSFEMNDNDSNDLLHEILSIAKDFDQTGLAGDKKPSNFLRIALSHCEHLLTPSFVTRLRAIVRHTNSCAVLTISNVRLDPRQSFDVEHYADYVIQVQGIVDESKKKQFGENIDGVCEIRKLDSINSNKPMPKPKDLGFSFRKKRIIFQELHLQPEDDTTVQRETSSSKTISANAIPKETKGCGGGGSTIKGKSIDF